MSVPPGADAAVPTPSADAGGSPAASLWAGGAPAAVAPPPAPVDPALADRVASFVRGRDVGCPSCEYNLRDLHSAVCPECGAVIDLELLLTVDRTFKVRRRRALKAAVAVATAGTVSMAVAAVTPAGPGSSKVWLAPAGMMACLALALAGLVLTGFDAAIHADRTRLPRARNVASFAPVMHAWIGLAWGAGGVVLALAAKWVIDAAVP